MCLWKTFTETKLVNSETSEKVNVEETAESKDVNGKTEVSSSCTDVSTKQEASSSPPVTVDSSKEDNSLNPTPDTVTPSDQEHTEQSKVQLATC